MSKLSLAALVITAALVGCNQGSDKGSLQSRSGQVSTVAAVDLAAIPNNWKADVATAVRRIRIPKGARYFALNEGTSIGIDGPEIIFDLHEDGLDFAPRFGTYRLLRDGRLYELKDVGEDESDMWVPLANP